MTGTPAPPVRILVVANRTAAAQRLVDAVERRAAAGPCTFTLLVPDVAHHRDADWTLDMGRRVLAKAAGTAVDGLAGGPDPFLAVQEAVATGRFDEIIVSTLSKKTSKWLRRDLVRKVEGLGLPVTAVMPRQVGQEGITDSAAFRSGMIGGGGIG